MDKNDIPFFLGGTVKVRQTKGYRAGLDAVLLAASISAKPDEKLIELGCGVGTALLCAAKRNPNAQFTGLEKQTNLCEIARQNAIENSMADQVAISCGSISALPFAPDQFDHVFFNPPYQADQWSGKKPAPGRDTAFIHDDALLEDWINNGLKILKTRGFMTVIHRADEIAKLVALLGERCGDIRILPIAPRHGENAHRVLIRARKGVRSPSRILPALNLHETEKRHTKIADEILRGQRPLAF